MDAGCQHPGLRRLRADVAEFLAVPQHQVEAVPLADARGDRGRMLARGCAATQELEGQFAAGPRVGAAAAGVAHIGHRGEAPFAREAQPGAAGLEVAAREQPVLARPPMRRRRGARVELVAIGPDHEIPCGMHAPAQQDQAHGAALPQRILLVCKASTLGGATKVSGVACSQKYLKAGCSDTPSTRAPGLTQG